MQGTDDAESRQRGATAAASSALRQLYSGLAPSGPAAAHLRATNADNVVIRSRVYRRARPWIATRGLEERTITVIKLIHTVVFAQLAGFVLLVTWSGLRNRFTRRERLALLAIAGEAAVVLLNQGRCPLTVVVEDLGADHGSVSDILLPDWAARHIPHISSGLLAVGFIALAVQRIRARPFLERGAIQRHRGGSTRPRWPHRPTT